MKKVLIIEDDTFLQGLAANKLGQNDFDVSTASTGEEALTQLVENQFDVILLDLMLPDISGFDILKNLKDSGRETPVIVFSNLSDDANIKNAIDLGAIEYLIKSNFTLEELVQKVKRIS